MIKSCRFLGRAEMALSDTWLSSLKIWLPLMRCDAGDTVRWAAVFVRPCLHGMQMHACVWMISHPCLPAAFPSIHLPHCSGQVQLDITWEATPRSVLTTKLRALERVLAQRQEILAALRPVPASVVRTWAPPEQGTLQVCA